MIRYAIVRNARSRQEAEAYLPSNYKVIYDSIDPDLRKPVQQTFVIAGEDDHGWTLDGYIVPRYASGLIWVEEIDLSHPMMKKVPSGLVG